MNRRTRRALRIGVALAVIGVTGGLFVSRHARATRRHARAAATVAASIREGAPVLVVPHAPGPITLDGDTDDPGWVRLPGPARTYDFVLKGGRPARPISRARLVWSGDFLYLALYAADEDIESHTNEPDDPIKPDDDAFRVVFAQEDVEYAIEVTPKALITDSMRKGQGPWDVTWSCGAHASMEKDGSINDPKGRDEEWAIELAVPFKSLGMIGEPGETIGMSLRRCDTPRGGGTPVCGGWGEGPDGRGNGRVVLQ